MAINTNGLTTVARLKTFLGISVATYDTLLERIINSVSDWTAEYCDRVFQQATYTNQIYDGPGKSKLRLLNYPISSVTLQKRDTNKNIDTWSTIESEDYFVKESTGILQAPTGNTFNDFAQYYRVTYTAGYAFDNFTPGATLESLGLGDLEMAVWKLCGRVFDNRRNDEDKKQERIGDYSITYDDFNRGMSELPEVEQILDTYRRPTYGL